MFLHRGAQGGEAGRFETLLEIFESLLGGSGGSGSSRLSGESSGRGKKGGEEGSLEDHLCEAGLLASRVAGRHTATKY
jgi:hypothetical protein